MLLKITHITEYDYSSGVFLEPHFLRFRPKITPHSVLKDFEINIEPKPSGLSEQFDVENNHNYMCWFEGTHRKLLIESRATVEADDFNPFNFLIHPDEYFRIPFKYDRRSEQLLKSSLKTGDVSGSTVEYTEGILRKSGNQTIDFLVALTKEIHEEFKLKNREIGKPHHPDFTFREKIGSCRDLAWMLVHMLRQHGIACRFVSGYFYADSENPEFELHAWLEAYLPGAGWIGLDPSHGLLTSGYHIPVASSAFYQNTMPVSGSVRGNARSELKNVLNISLGN